MTTFMSSSQAHTHTNPAHPSPLLPKRSLSVTPRKVDLELARLKQLGKVSKKIEEGDGQQNQEVTNADITITSPRHSVKSPDSEMTLIDDGLDSSDSGTEEDNNEESGGQQQQDLLDQLQRQSEESQRQQNEQQKQIEEYKSRLQELNTLHGQEMQQLKDEHQKQLASYQLQLLQQEKLAHETMTQYMGQYESSQLQVTKLAQLVQKQDELIHVYMEQQQDQQHQSLKDQSTVTIMETEWHSLQAEKEKLKAGIVALKANMETNQAHMQMMMMVSTEIQNDFEQQKVNVEKRLVVMAEELAAKDKLLLHYQTQEQQQQHIDMDIPTKRVMDLPLPSSPTLQHHSLSMNNTELPTPNVSRYPSFVSSSSTSSIDSNPMYLSTRTSVPPSSPPPVTPLPPIPPAQLPSSPTTSTSTSSTSSTSSLKQQQHRYQQYQQQQQSRYFYQQQQKRQPTSVATLPSSTSSPGIALQHDAPIMDPLISPTLRASSLDELQHNGKPFWKNMKNKWRTS